MYLDVHGSRGTSLLECIVAMALSSLVLAAIARSISQIAGHGKSAVTSLEQSLGMLRAVTLVTGALGTLDSRRSFESVRLFTSETMKTAKGRLHPIASGRATSAPRPGSSIVSVLELELPLRASISRTTINSSGVQLEACFDEAIPFDSTIFRSYLAIGIGGAKQLIGTLTRRRGTCFDLQGTIVDGLFSGPTGDEASFSSVYPVRREYSVFVDRSGQFRYVGHTATRILESQPVTRGLRALSVRSVILDAGVPAFSITIHPSLAMPLTWIDIPILDRREQWDEALP